MYSKFSEDLGEPPPPPPFCSAVTGYLHYDVNCNKIEKENNSDRQNRHMTD